MKIDLRSSVPVGIREQDPLKQGLKPLSSVIDSGKIKLTEEWKYGHRPHLHLP